MLQTSETNATPNAGRSLPLLLLLFVGSGCAALIYEIVWFQLLQLVIGSSAYSSTQLVHLRKPETLNIFDYHD